MHTSKQGSTHGSKFRRQSSSSKTHTGSRSSQGSYRGGRSSFSRLAPKKRGFRKDRIDENLFINKAKTSVKEVYTAKHVFADFPFPDLLLRNLEHKKYVTPSPIQDQAIPLVLEGKDVIGIANTGTGKTAAFLLPLIKKLVEDKSHKVLILAPTRELAQQIEVEFRAFARGLKLFSVSCVGGAPIGRQMRELELGVHVVIGTPGRVKDLIDRQKLHLSEFGSVVLDEADRMLDMGFIDDIRFILSHMPEERHGLFFSATFSPEIKNLCHDFLRDPQTISVKTRDTASAVDQDVVRTQNVSQKIEMLHEILNKPECKKVLIFREMKRSVDDLEKELQSRGFKALALHGDMRNRERERAVRALATGQVQVVIATDVAARGIDIPDITHVINYDLPSTYDTYVHRIGRTGRGDKKGHSLTFI